MMYPFPEHVAPTLVLLVGTLVSQFEGAVPGATVRVTEGHRPNAVQTAYYAQGRKPLDEVNRLRVAAGLAPLGTAENAYIITKALPGASKHNSDPARAVDLVVVCRGTVDWSSRADCDKDGVPDYRELGELGERLGLKWGGRFKGFPDVGHLELP
jgi:peptidoglycan L-alanyl-D-glutamate endopeptidase CwlK